MPTSTAAPHAPSNVPAKTRARGALVNSLFDRLLKHFGPQNWWPADSAWEMVVGAILTQNTSWTNVEKALLRLKEERVLTVEAVARLPRRRLEQLIRSSGYFRQKARRLQGFARILLASPDLRDVLLSSKRSRTLRPEDLGALRERLLDIHGIGRETADSMLLYAGGLPVFVIDAYTRRIGQRMGLFGTGDYQAAQRFFEKHVVKDAALYNEFHALLVMLAKHFCTKRNPRCPGCPARGHCAFGRRIKQV